MSALGGLIGLVFGGGVAILAAGLRGRPDEPRAQRRRALRTRESAPRVLLYAFIGVIAFAVTGWPVAGLAAAVGAPLVPRWLRRTQNADQLALIEDLEAWIETLRDVLRAGGVGLQTAIRETARDAPATIRGHVQRLAEESRTGSFEAALDAFAARVAHPACDKVVLGLHLHGAERLGEMLTRVAAGLHREAELLRRADAERHPERLTAKVIVYITLIFLLLASLLTRSYLAPYASARGQAAVAAMLGLIGFGVWWSWHAARDEAPLRPLIACRTGR